MMGSSFLVFVSLFVVAFLFILFECNSEDLLTVFSTEMHRLILFVPCCFFVHCFFSFFLDWIVSYYIPRLMIDIPKHWKCKGMKKSFVRFYYFLMVIKHYRLHCRLKKRDWLYNWQQIKRQGYLCSSIIQTTVRQIQHNQSINQSINDKTINNQPLK